MFTAIYKKVRSGYVAWVEEIPGVNTQGHTKAEARHNLGDALQEFVAARRELTKRGRTRGVLVRERIL
ncbi:MAG TPA: type II toxin-antitoxin system HicB family antitoxin, partial [Candidatus Paceibacterota bacterium]|nr:type II toxin-antitoxin system HicB family antitoxin [Candidatus Paceibacterota bacterium]